MSLSCEVDEGTWRVAPDSFDSIANDYCCCLTGLLGLSRNKEPANFDSSSKSSQRGTTDFVALSSTVYVRSSDDEEKGVDDCSRK